MVKMQIKDRVRLNTVTHSVRASQAALLYGVGAMVDFQEQTLMTASPETWNESVVEIHDERLERLLGIDYIGMPAAKDDPAGGWKGLSYCRFPEWYFCPKCRRIRPLKNWVEDFRKFGPKKLVTNDAYMTRRLLCVKCNVNLVPPRLVVACGHGHIDDFPWVKWAHARAKEPQNICSNPLLTITSSGGEGVEGISVTCTCGAKASLKGIFDRNIFELIDEKTSKKYDFYCTGRHPWKNQKEECNNYPKVLLRGSSSVYFPAIISSLVIPPFSNRLTNEIQNSKGYRDLLQSISVLQISNEDSEDVRKFKESQTQNIIKKQIQSISLEIGKVASSVSPVLERILEGKSVNDQKPTKENYRLEEYEVLAGDTKTAYTDDFVSEKMDISDYQLPYIKGISLIHKVREVQALLGFSRLNPVSSEFDDDINNSTIVNIKENDMNWYPGYELRGEGIFIEFNEEEINRWSKENKEIEERVKITNDNYKKSYWGKKNPRIITAKFLLLHTLSHLLMKQLSFECGYNIASIKERLYYSDTLENNMSGILIYTASGDSEGTMGGLVRQGRPDVFPSTFKKAIKSALKCSNDPVCSLSQGQGRDSLNLAACYSCTLVPETSCEEYNVFLDRGVVIGTFDHPDIGFFSKEVYGNTFVAEQPKTKSEHRKKTAISIDITDFGIDLSDESYKNIWVGLKTFANECEISLIDDLIMNAEKFDGVAKPHRAATFIAKGRKQALEADLIWPEKKVILFTSENEAEYKVAANSQWKCFCTADSSLSWDKILKYLK